MQVCDGNGPSNRHEPIVHDSNDCPLCEIIDRLDGAQKEINDAAGEVEEVADNIEAAIRKHKDSFQGVSDGTEEMFQYAIRFQPVFTIQQVEKFKDAVKEVQSELENVSITD